MSSITGVTGALADPSVATGTDASRLALLNDSGKTVVGTLTITGTSHDKRLLAAFVDRLGSVRGVTVPLPASVTGRAGNLTYSINALITADALGGRFTQHPDRRRQVTCPGHSRRRPGSASAWSSRWSSP